MIRNPATLALAAAFAAGLGMAGPALVDAARADTDENVEPDWTIDRDRAFVVDAPDLRALRRDEIGVPLSAAIGRGVFGNGGAPLGTVADFFVAPGGEIYAVLDTAPGAVSDALGLVDDEVVIVPVRELRVQTGM